MTNMSSSFVRVSKGYVDVPTTPEEGYEAYHRCYCELYLSSGVMCLQIRIKIPKGYSYSYSSGAGISTLRGFVVFNIPKNVHLFGGTVNELCNLAVERLNLFVFEESRKWLTEREKNVAEMFALGCIDMESVKYLLGCDARDIPQAWLDYVYQYGAEYDAYVAGKKRLRDQLNTFDGLERMLKWCKNHCWTDWTAKAAIQHYLLRHGL